MRINLAAIGAGLALTAGALVSTAQAAVPWSQPNGSIPGQFSYSNGQSANGLFGDPQITANGFVFFPTEFIAVSENGVADTATDLLSVTLDIAPGNQFVYIQINEVGDYSIAGTGTVQITGLLALTNLDNGQVYTDTLDVTPSNVITSGFGEWDGVVAIALPQGVTRLQLVLNNNLQATTAPGSSSLVQKKVVSPGVEISVFVPEPGSALAILSGVGLLGMRRRRA